MIYRIDILIDTGGVNINATEGSMVIPDGVVVESISTLDSSVLLWVQTPFQSDAHTISWSGAIPHGFSGIRSPYYEGEHPGKIFTLTVRADVLPVSAFSFSSFKSYINDGKGTLAPVSVHGIIEQSANTLMPAPASLTDFVAEVAADDSVFSNQWFISFSDDVSSIGIDHYEVAETKNEKLPPPGDEEWHEANSPYLLLDQERQSYVHIKSIDGSGGERIVTIDPHASKPHYAVIIFAVLVVGIIALVLKKYFRHHIHI